ncbi:ATP-binding protein [Microbacterium kribbense]|uniref:ATP-binding protein n=1 Tax=Microbacterium kribbense TaxID=433645 RepID=A0ABP7H1Z4_9MICO
MTRHAATFTPADLTPRQVRALRTEISVATRPEARGWWRRPWPVGRQHPLPEPAVPGRLGPGAAEGGYWNLAKAWVAPHQATSQHIAGIYPFVADSGLGHRGPILGVDLNADALWHFSPWEAYGDTSDRGTFSTNILVLGAYRGGKSGTVKTLITRSIAFGHQAVVPSDPKGEWVRVAEAVPGGRVIRLGGGTDTRLNPLARGPRRTGVTDEQHEQLVKQRRIGTLIALIEMTLGARLTAVEHAAILDGLDQCIAATGDRPTLRGMYEQLRLLAAKDHAGLGAEQGAIQPLFVLRRFVEGDLSGLFEDESTVEFDQDAPIVVIDTSELFARGDLAAQLTQVCSTAWIQAVISDRDAHRTRYVVREEGWRDMTSLASLQMFQQWLKLSRHYGISNIVILHKVGDLDAVGDERSPERSLAYSIIGDIENKFIFRVNHQEHTALRQRLNLPVPHVEMARHLRKGEFLAYVGQYAYLVDCFATSTPWERDLFDTDDAISLTASEATDWAQIDSNTLDAIWPGTADADVNGWLESPAEQTTVEDR